MPTSDEVEPVVMEAATEVVVTTTTATTKEDATENESREMDKEPAPAPNSEMAESQEARKMRLKVITF